MCVHVCAGMCACVGVCVHECICMCVHGGHVCACGEMCVQGYVCAHKFMCAHIDVCAGLCVCVHVCACLCGRECVCMWGAQVCACVCWLVGRSAHEHRLEFLSRAQELLGPDSVSPNCLAAEVLTCTASQATAQTRPPNPAGRSRLTLPLAVGQRQVPTAGCGSEPARTPPLSAARPAPGHPLLPSLQAAPGRGQAGQPGEEPP